ncbi:MAG: flagellar protein FlgN [Clostridiaceae bacterium]|nr:flagellar protein FlgN [Clostridiaceae bacterium]MBW4860021.1 flagellar protein FlgN [Clostridiaceae bacterium]MBW4867111.1 flagellar protein FlgN [Clostridiaceae bacterium]
MTTFKEELMDILKEQLEALKELDSIAMEKTDIIMNDEIDGLKGLTVKEEGLINKVATLELEREHLLDSWGIGKETSLSTIISNIPEEKEDLEKLGEELFNVLKTIEEKNKTNNALIKDSLDWIEFNLNIMTNATIPPTYGNENKKSKSKNSLFDRKV